VIWRDGFTFTTARNNLVFAQYSPSRIPEQLFFARYYSQPAAKYNVTKGESSCTIVPLSGGVDNKQISNLNKLTVQRHSIRSLKPFRVAI